MLRIAFILLIALHGLIHLLGFAKAFGLAELPQLTQPISCNFGLVWLLAALLLLATAAALPFWPWGWWMLSAVALVLSQVAIAASWSDAKAGSLANLVLLVAVLYGFASQGPWSLRAEHEGHLRLVRTAPAAEPLDERDLAPLPGPVQRYLRGVGAFGQPRVRNVRLTWTGRIRSGPESPWMPFRIEQVNTFDEPARFFFMEARMKGLPVDVLHVFDDSGATMRVRVLSAVPMVDARGPELTRAETVTFFNDLCFFAPGALISPAIAWEPVDERTVRAAFTLRGQTIRAELRFNERGELVDFSSEDRLAASADGKNFTRMRWTTPVGDYAQLGPVRVGTRGEAWWHPASGAYSYGEFRLTSLAYNVDG